MKQIFAVIQPTRLEPVIDALTDVGVTGMTVSEARGFGRQGGVTGIYRGVEYTVTFVPKVRIDVVVPDGLLEAAVHAIREAARTGEIGDGKVFVTNVEAVYRVRTDDVDEAALV